MRPEAARIPPRQSGSTLLYIVVAITIFAALAAGTLTYFSSSSQQSARLNCTALAQYMAESGIRYAAGQLRSQTDLATAQAMVATLQTPAQYTVTDAGTFTYDTITGPTLNGSVYTVAVTCTGTACTGADQSTYQTTSTFDLGFAPGGGNDETISFEEGMDKFPPAGTGGQDGDDIVQADDDEGTLIIGNGANESYGCAWYTGDTSPCTDGICEFGSGFRAYYEIMLSSNVEGDGFVFAIVNAQNNTVDDCGGDPSMGELLAYAGSGNSGHGLQAPKLGLEFDFYDNTGDGDVCNVGNRNDYSSADHVAWLFWGLPHWTGGCNETYDDNRHGAGVYSGSDGTPPNGDMPTNPVNIGESGAGYDGYYYESSSHWMRDYNRFNNGKKFRIRIEVDRAETANADGNYCYTLKGWIVKDNVDLPEGMDDVTEDYYDPNDEATWPQVEHMAVLSSSRHNMLDTVIFGWTVATGMATQTITISDFELKFKNEETVCPATSKPDDFVVGLPFYEGKGNTIHNLTSWGQNLNYAYWLKGRSCPGCAALFFDEAHGPFIMYDNKSSTMTDEGTVSAWVNLKEYSNYQCMVHKGNDWDFGDEVFSLQFTEENFRIRIDEGRLNYDRITNSGQRYRIDDGHKKPIFCLKDGNIYYCVNSDYELDLDKWYHLTATWDSNAEVMEFFVNGTKTATFDATAYGWTIPEANNAWNELLIGSQGGGRFPFHGIIDDVYLYDRVLTDEEILNLYQDGHLSAQEE